MPQYLKDHIIYYAGPAKTPEGHASGSFGPTTAGRMDSYVPIFQAQGASMVMLAKGNRSKAVTDACKKYRRILFRDPSVGRLRVWVRSASPRWRCWNIPNWEWRAIYMITVKDFPAFILVDDKGNDFFENLL